MREFVLENKKPLMLQEQIYTGSASFARWNPVLWFVVLFLITNDVTIGSVKGVLITLPKIGILVFLPFLSLRAKNAQAKWFVVKISTPLIAAILLTSVLHFRFHNVELSFLQSIVIGLMFAWLIAGSCVSMETVEKIFKYLSLILLLHLPVSLYQSYCGEGYLTRRYMMNLGFRWRSTGLFGDPNHYAQIMLMLLPYTWTMFLKKGLKNKILFLAMLLGIFLSGSRNAFVASVLIFILFAVFPPYYASRIKIRFVSSCALFALLFFFYYFAPKDVERTRVVYESIMTGEITEKLVTPDRRRYALAKESWDNFLSSPVLGVGIGRNLIKNKGVAHNLFLDIFADFGILGFIGYLLLAGIPFKRLLSNLKRREIKNLPQYYTIVWSTLMGFISFCAGGLFLSTYVNRFLFLWVGLLAGLAVVTKKLSTASTEIE
ncbi:MAG: O-antigen ligase family protein [Planctomycetota bacterium]